METETNIQIQKMRLIQLEVNNMKNLKFWLFSDQSPFSQGRLLPYCVMKKKGT